MGITPGNRVSAILKINENEKIRGFNLSRVEVESPRFSDIG